jgi:hypothetical protein
MSPPSTLTTCDTVTRATLPPLGAVIAASIFIASIVATVCPARTTSPSATLTVTTPAKGAATWPRLSRSAFSATGTDLAMAEH